ncbi:MAG: hypothetical protein ILO42_02740, partial [Clostridia bacterium]|nr:hypothetical protein [Clostridia bacterium]
ERGLPAVPKLDLASVARLDFEAPDCDTFTTLKLAADTIDLPDSESALLHAANETAVALFLRDKIGFCDIFDTLEYVVTRLRVNSGPTRWTQFSKPTAPPAVWRRNTAVAPKYELCSFSIFF